MKALYDSGWHHPFAAYVAGFALLFVIARRLPFLYSYLVVFTVAILADANVTGAWTPLPAMGPTAASVLPIVFVILGDYRFFFFAERAANLHAPLSRIALLTLAGSLIVPVTTGVLSRVVPAMQESRVLFLVYECALLVIVLTLDRFRYAKSNAPPEVVRWIRGVARLFAGLYFGWAASDVLILSGIEAGHALRIVPNVLYYAALLPFIYFTAPPSMKAIAGADAA